MKTTPVTVRPTSASQNDRGTMPRAATVTMGAAHDSSPLLSSVATPVDSHVPSHSVATTQADLREGRTLDVVRKPSFLQRLWNLICRFFAVLTSMAVPDKEQKLTKLRAIKDTMMDEIGACTNLRDLDECEISFKKRKSEFNFCPEARKLGVHLSDAIQSKMFEFEEEEEG